MADLKARIGPKAGQFANKTWVRPGLITQHSPKRKLRLTTADRSFDQNSDFSHDDSDQDEQDESGSRSVSPSHNSTGKPNLMARMGITHLDYEELEVRLPKDNGVPKPQKSLLERVSDERNDDENSQSFSVPSNGISIGPDVVVAKSDVAQGMRPKQKRSVSQSVHIPDSDHSATVNGSVTHVENHSPITRHNNSIASNEDKNHGPPRAVSRPRQNGTKKAISSDPHPPSFSSKLPSVLDNNSMANRSKSSSTEEGELSRSASTDQVRDALLPLMLQNADSRAEHTEGRPNSRPNRTLDPSVLTPAVCSSFAKGLPGFQKELQAIENANHSVQGKEYRRTSITSSSTAPFPPRSSNLPEGYQSGPSRDTRGEPSPASTSYISNNSTSDIGPPSTSANPSPTSGRQNKAPPSSPANFRKAEGHQSMQASTSYADLRSPNANTVPIASSLTDRRNSQALSSQVDPTSPRRNSDGWALFRGKLVREYHSPEPETPKESRSYHQRSPPSPAKSFQDRRSNHSPILRRRSLDRDPGSESRPRMLSPQRREWEYERSRDRPYAPRDKGISRRGELREDSHKRRRSLSPDRQRKYRQVLPYGRRTPSPRRRRSRSRTPPPASQFHRLPRRSMSTARRPRSNERTDARSARSESKTSTSRKATSSRDSPSRSENMDIDDEEEEKEGRKSPGSIMQEDQMEVQQVPIQQQPQPPCHHVPGLWFMIRGLDRQIATLECEFTIDHETAVKWNIFPINNHTPHVATEQSSEAARKRVSLQLCCFPLQLFSDVVTKLDPDASDTDRAEAIFALEQSWPEQGCLTIVVNPESTRRGIWLPRHLGPGSHVQIESNVHEGQNNIQFLQLSGMAEYIFVLYATEVIDHSPPFLPLRPQNEGELFDFSPAVVTISREP